ncbi:condensation domain-containing protein, partial [Amycolatopsis mediterranei]|uniref:condensation domain-containing protein n=1 Tax=Amycolatopsis mediterranei TaxID=33910 RepID=UPI00332414E2
AVLEPGAHRDPRAIIDAAVKYRVVHLQFVPSVLDLFLDALTDDDMAGLASLRSALSSGEALRPITARRFSARFGDTVELDNTWGVTEASIDSTHHRVTTEDGLSADESVPIGTDMTACEVRVRDARLDEVPAGEIGELCIGGEGLARGYLGDPRRTALAFVPAPGGRRVYRTGDRAVRLPGGDLLFLGRRDGQVKIRGYRVELGEIERALSGHPDLRGVVVTAPADDTGRQRLIAYVVAAAHAPAPAELRSWLGDRLPPYLVPATYLVLDELPLTANGKVDRTALPVPEAIDRAVQREYAAPRGDTERMLAECWAHVLRVERVGVHDNFFELGGDSIMTLQVVAGARQAGLRISPKLIFRYPTVAQLAPQATPITTATPHRAAAKTGEWFPLAPIQRAFAERDLPDHHHYNQSVVLTLDDADPGRMAAALRALVAHSPALRTRFDLGALRQRVVDREDADLLWCRDFASADAGALTAAADAVQSSLDIVAGPVVRAGLFRTGDGPDRLLLAVHHLVVDTLSWRSLIEDLAAAYEGTPFAAPTSSYQDWIAALDTLDVAAAGPGAVPALPVDHDHGPDTVATAASVHVRLSEEDTERLLRDVPRVHRVRAEDLVVTAAAKTLAQWSGGPAVLDVER